MRAEPDPTLQSCSGGREGQRKGPEAPAAPRLLGAPDSRRPLAQCHGEGEAAQGCKGLVEARTAGERGLGASWEDPGSPEPGEGRVGTGDAHRASA